MAHARTFATAAAMLCFLGVAALATVCLLYTSDAADE